MVDRRELIRLLDGIEAAIGQDADAPLARLRKAAESARRHLVGGPFVFAAAGQARPTAEQYVEAVAETLARPHFRAMIRAGKMPPSRAVADAVRVLSISHERVRRTHAYQAVREKLRGDRLDNMTLEQLVADQAADERSDHASYPGFWDRARPTVLDPSALEAIAARTDDALTSVDNETSTGQGKGTDSGLVDGTGEEAAA